ncbi:uncharacterized protein Hap1MRO34_006155 isoform 1-T2 [Clarias gariepinus]
MFSRKENALNQQPHFPYRPFQPLSIQHQEYTNLPTSLIICRHHLYLFITGSCLKEPWRCIPQDNIKQIHESQALRKQIRNKETLSVYKQPGSRRYIRTMNPRHPTDGTLQCRGGGGAARDPPPPSMWPGINQDRHLSVSPDRWHWLL